MTTASKKLSVLSKPSDWKKKLNYQIENEAWLDKSADIGFLVLERLNQLGKSQSWLAKQIGVSRQHISKIVKGSENLTLKTIYKLEGVLGISLIEDELEKSESEIKSREDIQKVCDQIFSEENIEDKIKLNSMLLSLRFVSIIDEAMEKNRVNKKTLAKEIGISPAYITQLFRGDRILNFKLLTKMAVALDVDFEILLKAK